jgi:hypothetical protein
MKIHDISLPIFPGMVVWPDDPNVSLRRTLDQSKGDLATVSELALGVHTGTHLDAPLHFVPGGVGWTRSRSTCCAARRASTTRWTRTRSLPRSSSG